MPEAVRTMQLEDIDLALKVETGALIVSTPYTKAWMGAQVELYAGADPYEFRSNQTVALAPHRIKGVIVLSAIFPALPAGSYRAFASGRHPQVSHVTIVEGEVAEIQWR